MEAIDELIELLKQDKVIPFIGAGVSCASANIPGWKELILSGLDFGRKKKLLNEDTNQIIINAINNDNLVLAANSLKEVLAGYPYKNWLKEVFNIKPLNTSLLDAIIGLDAPFILTTNFDKFIEESDILNPLAISHDKYQKAQNLIKSNKPFVLHLHGVFDESDSVILSKSDYDMLNTNKGYKDFVLSLMKNYHLLFIGCSKDGIMDNDFFIQFSFIKEWLMDSANKHYTIVNESDLINTNHIKLLRECNVEFISYGNDYILLADFVEKLNPNKRKRVDKIEKYREELTDYIQKIKKPLDILSDSNLNSAQRTIIYDILEKYNNQIKGKREKLEFLQSLISTIINSDELYKYIKLWNEYKDNPIKLNPTEFITNAIIAYNCLKKIPEDIIEDFKYHGQKSILHPYFYSGYLGSYINELENARKIGRNWEDYYSKDEYLFENLKRILDSLRGLLSLNSYQFYNELNEAVISNNIPNSFLLASSNRYISIFNPINKQIYAQLPIEGNKTIESVFLSHDKDLCIIANTREYLFKWNPKEDIFMNIFYSIEKDNPIGGIINCYSNIIKTIIRNEIVVFENFTKKESIKLNDIFDDIIDYKDGFIALKRVYSLYSGDILYRIDNKGNTVPILSTNDLLTHLENKYKLKNRSYYYGLFGYILKKIRNLEQFIFLRAKIANLSSFVFIIDIENSKYYSFEFPEKEYGICFCFDSLISNDDISFIFGFLYEGGERILCKHIQLSNEFEIKNEIIIKEKKTEYEPNDIIEIQYITDNLILLNEEGNRLRLVDLSTEDVNDYDYWDDGIRNMKYHIRD
ncbi:MAG: SIR2 family protein [Tannerellaceae bacterium]|jgi:predicted RNA-binding protein Jag|nr:SIR2 family protein [Tannerellaceae bacterium]